MESQATFTAGDVSVVIPSYNSRLTIEACLESLERQSAAPLEVIVVDSSEDCTSQIIASRFPQVRVRRVKRRIFPGPARNLGAGLAVGSIIAFLDADCIAAPDWVSRIVENHNQGRRVVGGAVEVGNRRSAVAWAGHLGEFREFLPAGQPRPVVHVPTCNISYRKLLFDAYGGFPDAYYPQEDLLFNYLLGRRGIRVWFDPALRVRHFAREGLRDFLSHQHRIGRVTRSTLRRIDLPGSALARRPGLAWISAPFLGLFKFLRTLYIFASDYQEQALRRPAVAGLLFLGSVWWARGFAASARKGLSGIRGWDDPNEPIFERLMALSEAVEPK